MTFEQSTPDSTTSLFNLIKIMLVPFESLGDALQLNMFKNDGRVVKYAV